MTISISEHFTYGKLLRFAFPTIIMMIFTSLYTIVDGIFVSNLVGAEAFTALNLIWPAVGILGSFGFMIGTGGVALVSKTLGEGQKKTASQYFSMLIAFEVILGITVSVLTLLFIKQLCVICGATPDLMADCIAYGWPLMACQCFFFLSTSFQSFLVAAGKAKFGLAVTVAAGLSNMILDYVFIAWFKMGIAGASYATALNWIVGALIPLVWFWKNKESDIHLCRFRWKFKAIGQSCFNGMSEMVTQLSMSLVLLLYNQVLMRIIGPDGVIAYGVIQYLAFLFSAAFLGYSMAVSPCIGYQFGAENHAELKNLLKKSLIIIGVGSIVVVLLADLGAPLLSGIFVSYSDSLMEMTENAIRIFAFSFLLSGYNIFASGFFTSLNNGPVSAVISLMRTFVFQVVSILWLPTVLGLNGVWNASNLAEALSFIVSVLFLVKMRKRYGY